VCCCCCCVLCAELSAVINILRTEQLACMQHSQSCVRAGGKFLVCGIRALC
jgi:hypothetical protein